MAKDRDDLSTKEDGNNDECHDDRHRKSKRKKDEGSSDYDSSDSEDDRHRSRGSGRKKKRRHSRGSRRRSRDDDESSHSHDADSGSESEGSDEASESDASGSDSEESEGEMRRRRKRRERKRKEREHEKERRRRRKEKEKEKKRKREKEGRGSRKKKDNKKDKKKNKEKDAGKKGAVTDSWGKYGIIKETDMWNKRPEFTAWLLEVKQVNLETLPNWEEKQMFKEFMEDHNTATFPSKKYYGLDAYHHRKMEKEMKKGLKKLTSTERTVFNDEEQRRQELIRERERHKEEQVEALKRSMQSGMAQAMKDQARLREEMAYQYRLGNFEAAAAIQKRLDPDVAM